MTTPERWNRVRDVLEQALEMAPEKRGRFLDVACSTDHSLRSEVESLLSSEEARSSFLLAPPVARAVLTKGTRLGEYEIVSMLGAGGMGEVYRAKDTRLGRDVAIKVLPAHFSSDADRLRRFEQEARAAAALNHPNILAVHQLGSYQGSPYLVTELLEGRTLREELKRGPLSQRKAVEYGEQIARGLAAAHEKGIVHRDLKPDNLFITKDGRVKILDFGLAKLAQEGKHSAETVATFDPETEPGLVLGTVGYMSPEQVRGQAVDHRADIFSFGAILYEMLTGKRAFLKGTSADTMSAILTEDPPRISQIQPNVSPGLQRVVQRCLEKDPEHRFHSAHDLAYALEALTDSTSSPSDVGDRQLSSYSRLYPDVVAQKNRRPWWIRGSVAVGLAVLGTIAVVNWTAMFRPGMVGSAFQNPAVSSLTSSGDVREARISPDGKYLAYISDKAGKYSLWVRQISAPNPVQVVPPGDDLLWDVAFSSDGSSLDYASAGMGSLHGRVYQIPSLGGTPRLLFDPADTGVTFSPDGQQVAYLVFDQAAGRAQVMVANKEGGTSRALYEEKGLPNLASGIQLVRWSPDGTRLAAIRNPSDANGLNAQVAEIDVKTAKMKPMVGGRWRVIFDAAWLPDGSGLAMIAAPKTGLPTQVWLLGSRRGTRTRISNDLNQYLTVSVSADGRSIVATQWNDGTSIWVAPSGEPDAAKQITNGVRDGSRGIAFTPNDRIVFAADHSENWDLFMVDADGANLRQLTYDGRFHTDPTVCEGGRSVVYSTDSAGASHLWKMDLKSGAATQLTNGSGETYPACGPTSGWVYYNGATKEGPDRLFRVPAKGGVAAQVMDRVVFGGPSFTPDEKQIGIATGAKDGSSVIGMYSTASGEFESEIALPTTGLSGWWMPDGRFAILDRRAGTPNLWAKPRGGGKETQLTHFIANEISNWVYSPDGRWIAMVRGPNEHNAVIFRTDK